LLNQMSVITRRDIQSIFMEESTYSFFPRHDVFAWFSQRMRYVQFRWYGRRPSWILLLTCATTRRQGDVCSAHFKNLGVHILAWDWVGLASSGNILKYIWFVVSFRT
jgi:hypothetical protein